MLRQLNNLSRFTTSSIKYAANNTAALVGLSASSRDDPTLPSPQLIAYWITETQKGLDAFFNDEFEVAQIIFMQHHEESPFHAVGFALVAYVEAMLGFETEKILTALERIGSAEILARQFAKKAKRKNWHNRKEDDYLDEKQPNKKTRSPEIQYELLATNCMIMSSTIQFLRNSWLEYMKAAYKLRKAYKLYEQMFESLTGQKASDYASILRSSGQTPLDQANNDLSLSVLIAHSPHVKGSWNDKRISLFNIPPNPNNGREKLKPRPMSTLDITCTVENMPSSCDSFHVIDNAIESGIFFGIGLFSLIFSLLPPRVNKILNTLGFHSSRPFALHLLQQSFKNQGLYSSLSALTLLAYYTNLSLFIHPQLLPSSLSLENARHILDQMKSLFPHGKIWKLLEGKLCKMEGKTRRGVEILRDARRRDNTQRQQKKKDGKPVVCELVQLQALAVYEMGWGQIFLGDYFQAAETFFRLESMNNWSRAFYHYIATCCMFADEEYDKSAMEFMQIPTILKRKRHLGGRLLPNEIFAERKIKHWKSKRQQFCSMEGGLDGPTLKRVVVVHPLWELIYLWNGFSQLTQNTLFFMKQSIETTLATLSKEEIGSDMSQLYLLLGVSVRELGDYDLADMYLRQSIRSEDSNSEDRWVIPHGLYEMAALCCFQLIQTQDLTNRKKLYKEAQDWIQKSEKHLAHRHNSTPNQQQESVTSDNTGDSDWDSRLHVRCQLLIEKLEDFQ
ncbi:uncharacterized protein EV154DRAFT_548657 [Mucor mucedo]|uniref:uncharacterized protein n=1 Tax=Mucor mucedo TaxID=29922 RepID=UPI00221F2392|nr:uncharacterized protein EV154DRAFT_548657 [Mucor mucedo]KAI7895097.1 hypothetical protein EV154DRAFT_548657 [Mucor mucedo]